MLQWLWAPMVVITVSVVGALPRPQTATYRFVVATLPASEYTLWTWEDGTNHVQSVTCEGEIGAIEPLSGHRFLVSTTALNGTPNLALVDEHCRMLRALTNFRIDAEAGELPEIWPMLTVPHTVSLVEAQHFAVISAWAEGVYQIDLHEAPVHEVQLLLGNGYEATVSHDGRYIAYREDTVPYELPSESPTALFGTLRGGETVIRVGDLRSRATWAVTSGVQGRCSQPDWHPTRHRLVYRCSRAAPIAENACSAYITNLEDGTTTCIPLSGDRPRWSPDGERIVSVGERSVYVLTLKTMTEEEILISWEQMPELGATGTLFVDWFGE